MEVFRIEDLTFRYPKSEKYALRNIELNIKRGDFLVVMGKSGSGKSTFLRNLKPTLAPIGEKSGKIFFAPKNSIGRGVDFVEVEKLHPKTHVTEIGFVLQNPDNQIVTDKVWHELAFGLENIGIESNVIRMRVAEMANFFGIQTWFNKETKELSGGQKQILNFASVMLMKPQVLILDEPTSQLDPVAATEFLQMVKKINREIGTTIIMSEHRLDEVLPMADRVVVMEEGAIIADDTPANVGGILSASNNNMFYAMPSPMQAYSLVYGKKYGQELDCPIDVRGGRIWLDKILDENELSCIEIEQSDEFTNNVKSEIAFELKDVWFRYGKNEEDILRGFDMKVKESEIYALVGGNGAGKSTVLKVMSRIKTPYRGKVRVFGKNIYAYKGSEGKKESIGMLPQDPQTIFVYDNVRDDLMEVIRSKNINIEEQQILFQNIVEMTEIDKLLDAHPYDISGGEQQRVALAKILLLDPKIILLDEPTKGLDNFYKIKLGEILAKLKEKGKSIVIVSHDIEFVGQHADRCAMIFDGQITAEGSANEFFSGNSFYTTSANKMSSHVFRNAITAQNVADLVMKNINAKINDEKMDCDKNNDEKMDYDKNNDEKKLYNEKITLSNQTTANVIHDPKEIIEKNIDDKKNIIPELQNSNFKKTKVRLLVLTSVIIALAVAGRAAFFMLPQVKPIVAIVIAGSYCLTPSAGFIVGMMSAFVSNFMFGQGPWTIWQMLAMGLLGMIAGIAGSKNRKAKTNQGDRRYRNIKIATMGGIGTFFIYGLLTDIWTIIAVGDITIESVLFVYMAAIPFNMIFAIATFIFLLLIANPMINKIDRIKIKYGFDI